MPGNFATRNLTARIASVSNLPTSAIARKRPAWYPFQAESGAGQGKNSPVPKLHTEIRAIGANLDMHLLTWNEHERIIQAGIGGAVTHGGAQVLIEEIWALVDVVDSSNLQIEIDGTRASRWSDMAGEVLDEFHFVCAQRGIRLNFVREEPEEPVSEQVLAILQDRVPAEFDVYLLAA